MKDNISWYFERKNKLLGNNILAICYKASKEEMKENGLTNENVLILVKNKEFDKYINIKDFNLKNCLQNSFRNEPIFLRIQSECLLGTYGDLHCDCEQQKADALRIIRDKGGMYIHLPQEAQGHGLHYKLKELELQVNGRDPSGKFVGQKDRNDAQKFLINNEKFEDKRSYEIIKKIFEELEIQDTKIILLSDSESKIKILKKLGLSINPYSRYMEKEVNLENLSEYLVKILDGTCRYNKNSLNEMMSLIETRKYNERTINTFLKIIEKINMNTIENLDEEDKALFLNTYNNIICGVEKVYTFKDSNITKVQNKFSCRVSNKIFGTLKLAFHKNIFSRIALEKLFFFHNTNEDYTVRIRDSKVLGIKDEKSLFLEGQEYLQESIFLRDQTKLVENEITKSKLRVFFENKDFSYTKKIDMITFISEYEIDGVNIYIKRIPNIENHIMDVYGKKEKILEFIRNITNILDKSMLNMISSIQLENEDLFNTNLSFADEQTAIDEELSIFNLMNK